MHFDYKTTVGSTLIKCIQKRSLSISCQDVTTEQSPSCHAPNPAHLYPPSYFTWFGFLEYFTFICCIFLFSHSYNSQPIRRETLCPLLWERRYKTTLRWLLCLKISETCLYHHCHSHFVVRETVVLTAVLTALWHTTSQSSTSPFPNRPRWMTPSSLWSQQKEVSRADSHRGDWCWNPPTPSTSKVLSHEVWELTDWFHFISALITHLLFADRNRFPSPNTARACPCELVQMNVLIIKNIKCQCVDVQEVLE